MTPTPLIKHVATKIATGLGYESADWRDFSSQARSAVSAMRDFKTHDDTAKADKKTYVELADMLRPHAGRIGDIIRHVASGVCYQITDVGFKESTMEIEFFYAPMINGPRIIFSRPIAELTDGRFEPARTRS